MATRFPKIKNSVIRSAVGVWTKLKMFFTHFLPAPEYFKQSSILRNRTIKKSVIKREIIISLTKTELQHLININKNDYTTTSKE